MNAMPRTTEEILHHADELAKVFEDHDPDPSHVMPAVPLRGVAEAFRSLASAEAALGEAVAHARLQGHTWAEIAKMVGTSPEAARQRYRRKVA